MAFGMKRGRRAAESTEGQAVVYLLTRKSRVSKRRLRQQIAWTILGVAGVLGGLILTGPRTSAAPPLTEQTLAGTWELQSINEVPVGPDKDSVLLAQRVTFRDGKLHGETSLRPDTNAATSDMPFPDDSVTAVHASADDHDVTVTWDGTYRLLPEHRLELRIGKAFYRVEAIFNPTTRTLQFDHDAVLTFRGAARYRPVAKLAYGQRG
jgi:hypothetical protein